MAGLLRNGRGIIARLSHVLPSTLSSMATTVSVTSIYSLMGSRLGSLSALQSLTNFQNISRGFAADSASPGPPDGQYITLNNLRDNPGANKTARRLGRGIGSSKGKTAGRGHKGQKARSGGGPKAGFEGGQSPLRLRVPKRGFHNPFTRTYHPLNLDKLQQWIQVGRLDPSQLITMKDLVESGVVRRKLGHGVKILGQGAEDFNTKVNIQVSSVSQSAREAIEKAGGSVSTVYYNELGLRALLRPEWFEKKGRLLPKPARPPPKLVERFDMVGELASLPSSKAEATSV